MAKRKTTKKPFDLDQKLTDTVIRAIEEHNVMPWQTSLGKGKDLGIDVSSMPHNLTTRKPYRGINILMCWIACRDGGFTSSEWITVKQLRQFQTREPHVNKQGKETDRYVSGPKVRADQYGKATMLVYWLKAIHPEERRKAQEENREPRPYMKPCPFWVYNRDQIDESEGALPDYCPPEVPETERFQRADDLIAATGANYVETNAQKCFYVPTLDMVHMPRFDLFGDPLDYYRTAFHELTHWTGHKSRLDRDQTGSFGTGNYAFEELIAEFGAAFICGRLGMEYATQHADYIASWLKALKSDKKFLRQAAQAASKAADLILSFEDEEELQEAA